MSKNDRRLGSPQPTCYWCHAPTEAETGYRGYDPDNPMMAEFQGMVKVVICGPGCPERPPRGVITDAEHMTNRRVFAGR